MGAFDYLNDYQPEKVADGNFEPFKGTFNCIVNSAKIEEYEGQDEAWKGARFFRYELEVAEGQDNATRKLWKSYHINGEKADGKGKVPIQKLADAFFTIGLEFKDEDSLLSAAEQFAEMTLSVRAWSFKPKDSEDKVQVHIIKGVAQQKGSRSPDSVPF